ncbi:MAG: hypothetical protein WA581_00340 [Candidatus Acidiferrales bacterium]
MWKSWVVLALSLLVLAPARVLAQDSGEPLPKLVSHPHDESLNVGVPGSPTDNADDDTDERRNDDEFTHNDEDFLTFALKLTEPDEKLLRTYLMGKMSGDKIVGTFMDESGVRGTWSATRILDSEKK